MGDLIHRALIATHLDSGILVRAQYIALAGNCFATTVPGNNGLYTFFMSPSGGKAGWGIERQAEEVRDNVKAFLTGQNVHWVEIEYGDVPPRIKSGYGEFATKLNEV